MPIETQLVVFDDVKCQGKSVMGTTKPGPEFSTVGSSRKVRSLILSTTKGHVPARGVVYSCEEESDLVYKPVNDSAAWK
ncbi:unnamed protein product [Phytophthora lilii]|uniref:Unnamed protein product n=1 Tax=Phytophthora lilii TaxID=2077276 RepID=A0A9W6TS36_9STRA|nr:unnamed protein product [Phytophthora lilii]